MKDNNLKKILSVRSIQDSLLFFALGIYLLGYALLNHYRGSKVAWEMSPYLFPVLIAIFIIALSISLFNDGLQQFRHQTTDHQDADPNWKGALVITIAAVLYYILMPIITFVPATIAFLAFTFYYLGERRIWLIAVLSCATAGLIYFIFGTLLHVMLP